MEAGVSRAASLRMGAMGRRGGGSGSATDIVATGVAVGVSTYVGRHAAYVRLPIASAMPTTTTSCRIGGRGSNASAIPVADERRP